MSRVTKIPRGFMITRVEPKTSEVSETNSPGAHRPPILGVRTDSVKL